jgi:hypothetical protein
MSALHLSVHPHGNKRLSLDVLSRILYLEFVLKFTQVFRFGFKSDTNHLVFR